MSENKRDVLIQKLFDKVQLKKEEIKSAERPNWKTNCSFGFEPGGNSARHNLQVINDVNGLVNILGFLYEKSSSFTKAKETLGLNQEFEWQGFKLSDWESDLKTRVNKIQITIKKKELEEDEKMLDKLLSPELKEQMILDAIAKRLG